MYICHCCMLASWVCEGGHNPEVDWTSGEVSMSCCCACCTTFWESVKKAWNEHRKEEIRSGPLPKVTFKDITEEQEEFDELPSEPDLEDSLPDPNSRVEDGDWVFMKSLTPEAESKREVYPISPVEHLTNSSRRILQPVASTHQNPQRPCQSTSSKRRMAAFVSFRTSINSTLIRWRIATHFRLSMISSIDWKAWSTSPSWMYNGDLIMFRFKREMSGRQPSRPIEDFLSPLSCSLVSPTAYPPSR